MLLKEHEQLPPMLQQPGPEVHVIGRGCGQRSCELAVLLETGFDTTQWLQPRLT